MHNTKNILSIQTAHNPITVGDLIQMLSFIEKNTPLYILGSNWQNWELLEIKEIKLSNIEIEKKVPVYDAHEAGSPLLFEKSEFYPAVTLSLAT